MSDLFGFRADEIEIEILVERVRVRVRVRVWVWVWMAAGFATQHTHTRILFWRSQEQPAIWLILSPILIFHGASPGISVLFELCTFYWLLELKLFLLLGHFFFFFFFLDRF